MKYLKILRILPFILVFLAALYKPYDADLGWHLKYGEYFFQHHQILRSNIFAIDMPGYLWQNDSWAVDLITYSIFSRFGFLGLTLLSTFVVTLTFYFFSKAFKLTLWEQSFIFPLLLYLESPINQVSFRGQQISLLFLGVESLILSLSLEKKAGFKLFLLIPLFLVWANVHGEFLLGLAVLAIWIGFTGLRTLIENRYNFRVIFIKEFFDLILIFLMSTTVTLVNPFGVSLYKDILSHIGNPLLKDIIEYLPLDKFSELWWTNILLCILIFFGILSLFLDKSGLKKLPFIGISILLFLLTFQVRRYAWPTYYFAIPLLQPLVLMFEPKNKKFYQILLTVILVTSILWTIKLKRPFSQFQTMNWQVYCQEYVGCSPAATNFMLTNGIPSNMLTFYNWGGWLIWNYPQIKPSIDGRMHLWKDDSGYSAFEDYYHYEQNQADINNSRYDAVFIAPDKPLYKRLVQLVNLGSWKMIYSDSTGAIFTR